MAIVNYQKYIEGNKDITEADIKFIEAYIKPHLVPYHMTAKNPFSGASVEVNPLVGALIEMVQELSYNQSYAMRLYGIDQSNFIQNFDRARKIARKLDSESYYEILD